MGNAKKKKKYCSIEILENVGEAGKVLEVLD